MSLNSPVVLSARNLRKEYMRLFQLPVVAVKSISFKIRKGEIVGLLGPNGAGKTTTFQMLLGVLAPTLGEVEFFGQSLGRDNRQVLEKVNFSSTYTNLPWQLTVQEALTYFSYLYALKHRVARVSEVITTFELSGLANRQVKTLSSGQLTKLNLAKAYLNEPEILFLDEPTASLDPETGVFLRQFILEDARKRNTTVLLASHNMNEVTQLCDRVLFMHQGVLLADDKPKNLAKKVGYPKLQFKVVGSLDPVLKICREMKFLPETNRSTISLFLPDKSIHDFLKTLVKRKIVFKQLRIIEPTLEDYFLSKAKQRENYV